jgi:hypothetical protein
MSASNVVSSEKAMVVLNSRTIDQMHQDGGCGFWVAKATSVLGCQYVVSTYNSRQKTIDGLSHGSAYMIGEIAGVTAIKGRCLVRLSRLAEINVANVWTPGGSNPVHYEMLDSLDIDINDLDWKAWPGTETAAKKRGLTIQDAKLGLAETFGVKPEQVEISIRA